MNSITTTSGEDVLDAMLGDFRAAHVVRLLAGDTGLHPIRIVDGDMSPRLTGERAHCTTPGGKPIRHPRSYPGRMVYHRSTLAVEVGMEWVQRMLRRPGGAFRRDVRHGVTTAVLTGSRQMIQGCTADAGVTTDGRRVWIVTLPDGRSFHAIRLCDLFASRSELRADASRAVRVVIDEIGKQRLAEIRKQRLASISL